MSERTEAEDRDAALSAGWAHEVRRTEAGARVAQLPQTGIHVVFAEDRVVLVRVAGARVDHMQLTPHEWAQLAEYARKLRGVAR